MNEELIDSAWRVLPNEFKEEVKIAYKRLTSTKYLQDSFGRGMKAQLETLFGHHNLTSDAEGEEMLTVSRKEVNDLFNRYERCSKETNGKCHDMEVALKASHFFGKMCALVALFGSKCLPDDGDNLSPEPKPAEPKYHIGQRVRHIPTRLVDVIDGISQSAPYIYHFKHMVDPINGQGIFESDLEPYTEPSPNQLRELTKKIDHIADVRKMMPNRLQIASMTMQGMLSNTTRFSSYEISDLVRISLNCADALLSECEKGGQS